MQLKTTVPPYHYPEPGQESVIRLGLKALDFKKWIHPDTDFEQFHNHKQEALGQHADRCYAELEESAAAQKEFSKLLRDHLVRDHDDLFEIVESELRHRPTGLYWNADVLSLTNSQYWVQEDICLLQADAEHYRLIAASVCSPSNWVLEEKIGMSVDEIHEPVPDYQEILASRVNRLLHSLKPDKPMLRYNWSLQPGNELLWRTDLNEQDTNDTFWRVERQTLVKLPETGAIVFGIRIFLHPLDAIGQGKKHIQDVVRCLPDAERTYKGLNHKGPES